MSCLYSSPEVKRTKMKVTRRSLGERAAVTHAHRFRCSCCHYRCRRPSRSTKTRSPPAGLIAGEPVQLSVVFLRKSSSAKSGFRSLCGHERRSSISHRAQFDQRFGTFQPAWLSLSRTAVPTRSMPGSCTGVMGRNVVAPGGYSKRFLRSNSALAGHFSPRNGPEDARKVGFRPAVHR